MLMFLLLFFCPQLMGWSVSEHALGQGRGVYLIMPLGIGVCTGYVWTGTVVRDGSSFPSEMATDVVGMLPTVMYSCLFNFLVSQKQVQTLPVDHSNKIQGGAGDHPFPCLYLYLIQ